MDAVNEVSRTDTVASGDWAMSGKTEASHETAQVQGHVLLRWLRHDGPYISMLLLGLAGVVFRQPVIYWVILTPVFAALSIVSGWSNFATPRERFDLVLRLALDWVCAFALHVFAVQRRGSRHLER